MNLHSVFNIMFLTLNCISISESNKWLSSKEDFEAHVEAHQLEIIVALKLVLIFFFSEILKEKS